MRKPCAAIGLCLFMVASSGEAADNLVNLGQLNIVHRSGLIENHTFRAPWLTTELAPKTGVDIRNTEKVQITIMDPNPLLFKYAFDGIQQTDSENFKAAQSFTGALQKLGAALGSAPAAATSGTDFEKAAAQRETIRALLDRYGFDREFFETLGESISTLSGIVASLDELTSRSAGDAAAVLRVKQDGEL